MQHPHVFPFSSVGGLTVWKSTFQFLVRLSSSLYVFKRYTLPYPDVVPLEVKDKIVVKDFLRGSYSLLYDDTIQWVWKTLFVRCLTNLLYCHTWAQVESCSFIPLEINYCYGYISTMTVIDYLLRFISRFTSIRSSGLGLTPKKYLLKCKVSK